MNKKLSFKKCLNESLKDINKMDDEITSSLKKIWRKYKGKVSLEEFIESLQNFELDDEDLNESLNEKLVPHKKFGHTWYEDDENYEIVKITTKSGHTFKLGDMIKGHKITDFDPNSNSIILDNSADYAVEDIESISVENELNESCDSKIECIHSEYDDDFGEKENFYDIETAHEFIDLDDTAPKARKYEEESEEIAYDDDF